MRLKVWGCRGSVPTPGPGTVECGGNTSCVEVTLSDGTVLVLDAGTGIRALGLELLERGAEQINLVLTHLHLDHVEGLRFFAPLWDERVEVDVWGPPSPVSSLPDRIARAFSPPLFPVDLHDVPARLVFRDVPRRPWTIGGASLSAELVLHPGPTVGYRIEGDRASFGYLPDHEPALAGTIEGRPRDWISAQGSPATSTCSYTTRSTSRTSTKSESAGAIRASRTRSRSRGPSTPGALFSSITSPAMTTARWSASKRTRRRSRAGTARRQRLPARAWSSSCNPVLPGTPELSEADQREP